MSPPKDDLIDLFASQHYKLTKDDINTKIDTIKNDPGVNLPAFYFFRAFVPYFYYLLTTNDIYKTFDSLNSKKYTGTCVGDAHFENYGLLLTEPFEEYNNNHYFSMNDADDGGKGILVADFLRYVTGCLLMNELPVTNIDNLMAIIFKGYNDGLKDAHDDLHELKDEYFSNLVKISGYDGLASRKGVAELTVGDNEKDYKIKNGKKQLEKSGRKNIYHVPSEKEVKDINDYFNNHKKGYEVKDILKFRKKAGGSGGLIQYRVLLEKDEKVKIYNMKTLVASGMFPLLSHPNYNSDGIFSETISKDEGDIANRVDKVFKEVRKKSDEYEAVKIGGLGVFIISPVWNGDLEIKIEDNNANGRLIEIIQLEAYFLGKVHRKYMDHDNKEGYITAIAADKNTLTTLANSLAEAMTEACTLAFS